MSAGGLRPLLAGVPRREGESVVVAGSRREIRVDGDADLAEAVLGRCDGHRTRDEILAGLPEADRADAAALLGELVAAGAVLDCREAWRILHEQSSAGSAFVATPGRDDLARLARERVVPEHRPGPAVAVAPRDTALAALIARRRSSELRPEPRPVAFGELSALLAAAYGPARAGHAPVASAGGLYPLLLHVAIQAPVGPLEPGIWWHDHEAGALRAVTAGPVDARDLLVPQELTDALAARGGPLVVISAAIVRQGRKYGNRAYRFALIEAGSAWQNLALAATELGVPVRPVGGVADDAAAAALRLGDAQPLLAVLVGA